MCKFSTINSRHFAHLHLMNNAVHYPNGCHRSSSNHMWKAHGTWTESFYANASLFTAHRRTKWSLVGSDWILLNHFVAITVKRRTKCATIWRTPRVVGQQHSYEIIPQTPHIIPNELFMHHWQTNAFRLFFFLSFPRIATHCIDPTAWKIVGPNNHPCDILNLSSTVMWLHTAATPLPSSVIIFNWNCNTALTSNLCWCWCCRCCFLFPLFFGRARLFCRGVGGGSWFTFSSEVHKVIVEAASSYSLWKCSM